jgi:hypothetical protein
MADLVRRALESLTAAQEELLAPREFATGKFATNRLLNLTKAQLESALLYQQAYEDDDPELKRQRIRERVRARMGDERDYTLSDMLTGGEELSRHLFRCREPERLEVVGDEIIPPRGKPL